MLRMEGVTDNADKMTSQQALCETDPQSTRRHCISTLKVSTDTTHHRQFELLVF